MWLNWVGLLLHSLVLAVYFGLNPGVFGLVLAGLILGVRVCTGPVSFPGFGFVTLVLLFR